MATPTARQRRRSSAAQRLATEVRDAAAAKGALLIPAFAVERTQELIVDLIDLMERGEVPAAPIFLDSPLAIRATEVFRQTRVEPRSDVDVDRLLSSPHLRFTETVDESKSIAKLTGFHIIIAASGMCDAGRIRHHLKRWLWNSDATVLLVGFQAQGTLGRFLADGAKAVRIQGEEIKVAARIRQHRRIFRPCRRARARALDRRAPPHSARACSWSMARSRRSRALPNASPSASFRRRKIFTPLLDDIYELSTAAPTPIDVIHRRRLAPEAVVTSRLAQRHVETDPRHQRSDRSRGRRPRPRRHHPTVAPGALQENG